MAAIFQTALKCIFLNENVWIVTKISLRFVPNGSVKSIPALVQITAWRRHGIVYWRIYASFGHNELTHWGRVMHICVSDITSIGSDNGLSPGRRQAIIRTNAGILLIGPLGTNFSEISIEIHILSFKKMHLKMSSGKWRPFCLGLNVLSEMEAWISNHSSVFCGMSLLIHASI